MPGTLDGRVAIVTGAGRGLRDPDVRCDLSDAVGSGTFTLGKEAATTWIFERLMVMQPDAHAMPTLATIAAGRRCDPVEA